MSWRFWQNSKAQVLSDKVRDTLAAKFQLDQQSVYKLRCVQMSGQYSGRPVRYVRILDPELVSSGIAGNITYDQLSLEPQRKALQFEGRIEKGGSILWTDLRPVAPMPNPATT